MQEASQLAFAVLMERHGPTVLRIACRRLLGDSPSVEDAFQAAFTAALPARAYLFHESGLGRRVVARGRVPSLCSHTCRRRKTPRHHGVGWAVLGRSDRASVASLDVIQAVHEEPRHDPPRNTVGSPRALRPGGKDPGQGGQRDRPPDRHNPQPASPRSGAASGAALGGGSSDARAGVIGSTLGSGIGRGRPYSAAR